MFILILLFHYTINIRKLASPHFYGLKPPIIILSFNEFKQFCGFKLPEITISTFPVTLFNFPSSLSDLCILSDTNKRRKDGLRCCSTTIPPLHQVNQTLLSSLQTTIFSLISPMLKNPEDHNFFATSNI